jgi:DNA-binding GntR family transcriptional regulator
MATQFGVSEPALVRAIDTLVREGLLAKLYRHRLGTTVTDNGRIVSCDRASRYRASVRSSETPTGSWATWRIRSVRNLATSPPRRKPMPHAKRGDRLPRRRTHSPISAR